jgi:hypothetical protein
MNTKKIQRNILPAAVFGLLLSSCMQAGGDGVEHGNKAKSCGNFVSSMMANPKKALLASSAALFGVTYVSLKTNCMSVDPLSVFSLIGTGSALYGVSKAYTHVHERYDDYNQQFDNYVHENPVKATVFGLGSMPIVAWSAYYLTPCLQEACCNPKITTAVIGAATASYYGYKCYQWLSGKNAQKDKQRKIAEKRKRIKALEKKRTREQENRARGFGALLSGAGQTPNDGELESIKKELEKLENNS